MSARALAICLCSVSPALAANASNASVQEPALLHTQYFGMQAGQGELVTEPFTAALFFREDQSNPSAALFEPFAPPAELPALVQHTASYANDPEFSDFASLLADDQLAYLPGRGRRTGCCGEVKADPNQTFEDPF